MNISVIFVASFLCFEVVSGLKINLSKSELVLVGKDGVEGLAQILGCRVSSLPIIWVFVWELCIRLSPSGMV
jgi:hypothetical protein